MRKTALLAVLALVAACNNSEKDDPTLVVRTRSTPMLKSFDSCDSMGERLRANLSEQMRVDLLQIEEWANNRGPIAYAESDSAAGSPGAAAPSNQRQEGVNFSGTNNQEQGVDEADFVKMAPDGYHVYVLSGTKLEVFGVPTIGSLVPTSSFDIEGYPTEMLIGNGRVVVFSSIYLGSLAADNPLRLALGINCTEGYRCYGGSFAKITVVNVADPAAPSLAREIYLEGYYQTARRVEDTVRMVSYGFLDVPGLITYPDVHYNPGYDSWDDEAYRAALHEAVLDAIDHNNAVIAQTPVENLVPRLYERTNGGALTAHSFTDEGCNNFSVADDGTSRGFTSILSLELLGIDFHFQADHLLSNPSTVYSSTSDMIIAEPAQDWWWYWNNEEFDEATNLHRFDISKKGLTTYTGSGRIPGTVRDQFSLSELDGNIRVATTTGQWNRWWLENPPPPDNQIVVLAGEDNLEIIGQVTGIGTGERIWSSRFVGDRGYLVTFRSIDPLWTIDLSDPQNPRVMGELQVPGVSTYIHPLADNRLLTIGFGGNEAGGLAWSTAVSLFDVSDFAAPGLIDQLDFAPPAGNGWSWAWSEANYEHKAFTFWPSLGLLAVPLSTYRYTETYANGVYDYHYEYKSGLELVKVDDTGLSSFGSIDHSAFYNSNNDWWWYWRDVRRSIFMHDDVAGDFVYALSDRGITVHKLPSLELVASTDLPGYGQQGYYYGWATE